MTSGAGSLWVLDFAGPLLRIDPASGVITKRFPIRGLGAGVAYGHSYIWMIPDDPAVGGGQEYLYKIDPSRDVIVKAAAIPGTGTACAASPAPYGLWIGCTAVARVAGRVRLVNVLCRRQCHHLDQPGLAQAVTERASPQRRIHPADCSRPR